MTSEVAAGGGEAAGPALFARYAYPPNALGYCGPDDPAALLGLATDARPHPADLRQLAARFEGAWPYLELIAASNGIGDPLDRRVVEAYWVGNGLLARVPPAALWRSIDDRFHRRAGPLFEPMAAAVPLGGVPHHSFHVFAVYPWLGLLRAGREGPALTVLDRCRIRWGTVESVDGDHVVVRTRLLTFCGSQLRLAEHDEVEVARWAVDGTTFVGALSPGDVVSLHWDWVCDRLSPPALARLRRWSAHTLAVVNATPAPGPAVAADASGGSTR
ncbi:MAG TPA: DUF6390 family protein [Acidimicrobiales bacterium]|nr:DUF6390 family protein [Acidimicrobiales bacterium]